MMLANVTFGVEVNVNSARWRAIDILGDEYDDEMSDEECVRIYLESEYSNGLGFDVEII